MFGNEDVRKIMFKFDPSFTDFSICIYNVRGGTL